MNATAALAGLAEIDYATLPSAVIERAKTSLRDVVGVVIYDSHHEVGDLITAYVERTSSGDTARLFGRGRISAPAAALTNGTYAQAIDYDDTFEAIGSIRARRSSRRRSRSPRWSMPPDGPCSWGTCRASRRRSVSATASIHPLRPRQAPDGDGRVLRRDHRRRLAPRSVP